MSNNFLYDFATGIYMHDANYLDFSNNYFDTVTTLYDQNGGTSALQYADGTILPITTGTDTWDPASIADGASETYLITGIQGCSSKASAHVTFNRELEGLVPQIVTGNTDTNVGTIAITLRNETGHAIDLDYLNLRYRVDKY